MCWTQQTILQIACHLLLKVQLQFVRNQNPFQLARFKWSFCCHFGYFKCPLSSGYNVEIIRIIFIISGYFLKIIIEINRMGSSCCKQGEKCPTHQDKTMDYVCIQKNCVQPLCENCIKRHRESHQLIGCPPNIVKYSLIEQIFKKKLKQKEQKQKELQDKSRYEFVSSDFKLKELTNQYFTRRYKQKTLNKADEIHLKGVVEDLQLFHKLQNAEVKQKFMKFLKRNLQLNEEIIDKNYSHLYI